MGKRRSLSKSSFYFDLWLKSTAGMTFIMQDFAGMNKICSTGNKTCFWALDVSKKYNFNPLQGDLNFTAAPENQ